MDRRERRRRRFIRRAIAKLSQEAWLDFHDPNYHWDNASTTRGHIAWQFDYRHPKEPPVNRQTRRRIRQSVCWGDILRWWGMPNRTIARAHRGGGRYVVLCPFHDEKTPSLVLFPDGGYHCHGCGATGDILRFVWHIRPLRTTRDIKAFFGPLMQPLSSA